MGVEQRIKSLTELGKWLESPDNKDVIDEVLNRTYYTNTWFTVDNYRHAIKSIVDNYLQEDPLQNWVSKYPLKENNNPLSIGLLMAGNIPMVGIHDLLSVLITGNTALVKLSSKDPYLLPLLKDALISIDPDLGNQIQFVEMLKEIDAVIATGSNNSSRYFEYYFGKYPNIIRKNRGSVAVLTGDESEDELLELGKDIFQYYGLGCRNVSKLYVPQDFDIKKVLSVWESFNEVMDHSKYKNNYDYNYTINLMKNISFLTNDTIMLIEDSGIVSPVATLYYESYKNKDQIAAELKRLSAEIQCIVSYLPIEGAIPMGVTQSPRLWDYADHVDTVKWLETLKN